MIEYALPGIWVRERALEVPLDHTDPGSRPAVELLEHRRHWSRIYDLDRLSSNEVPVAAAVYFDDMYVDSEAWVTNEYQHDGIGSGTVLTRLREIVRDLRGEIR